MRAWRARGRDRGQTEARRVPGLRTGARRRLSLCGPPPSPSARYWRSPTLSTLIFCSDRKQNIVQIAKKIVFRLNKKLLFRLRKQLLLRLRKKNFCSDRQLFFQIEKKRADSPRSPPVVPPIPEDEEEELSDFVCARCSRYQARKKELEK